MKFFLITVLLLLPLYSNLKIGGTFIIAAICKDGILIGSDSRNCWNLSDNSVAAYNDFTGKIYIIDNMGIAMAGSNSFLDENLEFYGLLNKFLKQNKDLLTVSNFHQKLFLYCKNLLTSNDYQKLNNNQLIIAGYLKNTPYVYYYEGNHFSVITTPDYRANGANDIGTSQHAQFQEVFKNNNYKESTKYVSFAIENVIKFVNSNGLGVIGGKASILAIKKGKSEWMQNNFGHKYNTCSEYFKSILSQETKLTYTSLSNQSQIEKVILSYLKSH